MAGQEISNACMHFIGRLKRREVQGSFVVALETALILRQSISQMRWQSAEQLIAQIKEIGRPLAQAQPNEFAVGNMVRRVLRMVREEFLEDAAGAEREHGLHSSGNSSAMLSLLGQPGEESAAAVPAAMSTPMGPDQKPAIIAGIQELMEELEKIYTDISSQALEHIHTDELIMTIGASRTIESFLRQAGKKRNFTVLVIQTFASLHAAGGRGSGNGSSTSSADTAAMAQRLTKDGLNVIMLPESATFSVMSRVHKVIIGAHAVLGNGGAVCAAGTKSLCQAANFHNTPVIVATGLYKFSPIYPFDTENVVELVSPEDHFSFKEGEALSKIEFMSPLFDYIDPDLIDLYITNQGGHLPSYVYRLVADTYDKQDYEL